MYCLGNSGKKTDICAHSVQMCFSQILSTQSCLTPQMLALRIQNSNYVQVRRHCGLTHLFLSFVANHQAEIIHTLHGPEYLDMQINYARA